MHREFFGALLQTLSRLTSSCLSPAQDKPENPRCCVVSFRLSVGAYASATLKRVIKTPKLYFRDTGLAAYLARWLTPETLACGAMSGAFFETYVISEILKSYSNRGLDYHYFVRESLSVCARNRGRCAKMYSRYRCGMCDFSTFRAKFQKKF